MKEASLLDPVFLVSSLLSLVVPSLPANEFSSLLSLVVPSLPANEFSSLLSLVVPSLLRQWVFFARASSSTRLYHFPPSICVFSHQHMHTHRRTDSQSVVIRCCPCSRLTPVNDVWISFFPHFHVVPLRFCSAFLRFFVATKRTLSAQTQIDVEK